MHSWKETSSQLNDFTFNLHDLMSTCEVHVMCIEHVNKRADADMCWLINY